MSATQTAPRPSDARVGTAHVGVSVTPTAVTVAQVRADDDRGYVVERFAGLPVPANAIVNGEVEDVERVARVLGATWRLAGASADATIRVAVDGPGVTFTRRPAEADKVAHAVWGIQQATRQQLAKVLPGKAVMASSQQATAALRQVFAAGSLQVTSVVPAGMAAAAALPRTMDTTRAVLLIDGDHATCAVEHDGKLLSSRTMAGAGHGATVAAWLEGEAPPAPADLTAVAEHAFDVAIHVAAIAPTLPTVLFLAGPAAQLPGMSQWFANKLSVPVHVADPLAGHEGDSALTVTQRATVAPRLLTAIGTALLGVDGSKANLP